MATTTGVLPATGNTLIDVVTYGTKWASNTLSYSAWDYYGYPGWSYTYNTALQTALSSWAAVANLQFIPAAPGGVFAKNNSDLSFILSGNVLDSVLGYGALGMACFPDPAAANQIRGIFSYILGAPVDATIYPQPEGDVFFDHWDFANGYLNPGGAGLQTLVHEIGHALGLKHPHNASNGRLTASGYGRPELDDGLLTVMSYDETSSYSSFGNQATPMPLDILAIQALYGPNMGYQTGNDTYRLTSNGVVCTVWDAGGGDTFDASGSYASTATIDLRPGGFSYSGSGSITAIAYNVVIENAVGSAYSDSILGNDVNNSIQAGSGNDSVFALGGDDAVWGGAGNDVMNGNWGNDQIAGEVGNDTLYGGQGNDLVSGGLSNDLVRGDLGTDTVRGDEGNDTLYGGQQDDVLYGVDGNDYVSGDRGNDTLYGGAGADIFAFRQEGGIDLIADFSRSQGDRIQIEGGLSYAVSAAGSDTVITLSDGTRIIVAGMAGATTTDWFVLV